jgi:membrane protease YdiL (CAAX protease family)
MFDGFLLLTLLIGTPGFVLWREQRRRRQGAPPRLRRYLETAILASVLLGLLAADWAATGRMPAALGLDWPLSARSLDLMLVATTVLAALLALSNLGALRGKAPPAPSPDSPLPATRAEFIAFLPLTILVGVAWEALFRGFLLYALTPVVGLFGAVAMASVAYAAAHGVAELRRLMASLAAALAFTLAYAFSHSLWWLIILHAGLPMIGASAQFRAQARAST